MGGRNCKKGFGSGSHVHECSGRQESAPRRFASHHMALVTPVGRQAYLPYEDRPVCVDGQLYCATNIRTAKFIAALKQLAPQSVEQNEPTKKAGHPDLRRSGSDEAHAWQLRENLETLKHSISSHHKLARSGSTDAPSVAGWSRSSTATTESYAWSCS